MNSDDEIQLNDQPSAETRLHVIERAVNSLIRNVRATNNKLDLNTEAIKMLAVLQKEQNSNVAKIKEAQEGQKTWINTHSDWHGEEDRKIAERVNRTKGRNEVLIAEWKIVAGTVSAIGIGALAGAVGNLLGWWGF